MEAQEQIRNANILLVTMKALGNEVAKNLVLAGISSLTICDNGIVTEGDLGAQFFLTDDDVGKPVRPSPSVSHRTPPKTLHTDVI